MAHLDGEHCSTSSDDGAIRTTGASVRSPASAGHTTSHQGEGCRKSQDQTRLLNYRTHSRRQRRLRGIRRSWGQKHIGTRRRDGRKREWAGYMVPGTGTGVQNRCIWALMRAPKKHQQATAQDHERDSKSSSSTPISPTCGAWAHQRMQTSWDTSGGNDSTGGTGKGRGRRTQKRK